jgi:hypothetical protein
MIHTLKQFAINTATLILCGYALLCVLARQEKGL